MRLLVVALPPQVLLVMPDQVPRLQYQAAARGPVNTQAPEVETIDDQVDPMEGPRNIMMSITDKSRIDVKVV